jgi:hypothetical protein
MIGHLFLLQGESIIQIIGPPHFTVIPSPEGGRGTHRERLLPGMYTFYVVMNRKMYSVLACFSHLLFE